MAKFKKGQSGNPKGRPKGTTTINGLLKKIGSEGLFFLTNQDIKFWFVGEDGAKLSFL